MPIFCKSFRWIWFCCFYLWKYANENRNYYLLIVTKLEQYDYTGATAIAVVMLFISFVMLLVINMLQRWSARRRGMEAIWKHLVTQKLSRRINCLLNIFNYNSCFILGLMLVVPLFTVLWKLLEKELKHTLLRLHGLDEYVIQAVKLTLIASLIAVPFKSFFGVCILGNS